MYFLQELNGVYSDYRPQFHESMFHLIETHPRYVCGICFSVEAILFLNDSLIDIIINYPCRNPRPFEKAHNRILQL